VSAMPIYRSISSGDNSNEVVSRDTADAITLFQVRGSNQQGGVAGANGTIRIRCATILRLLDRNDRITFRSNDVLMVGRRMEYCDLPNMKFRAFFEPQSHRRGCSSPKLRNRK
jgi:hypothetical protein